MKKKLIIASTLIASTVGAIAVVSSCSKSSAPDDGDIGVSKNYYSTHTLRSVVSFYSGTDQTTGAPITVTLGGEDPRFENPEDLDWLFDKFPNAQLLKVDMPYLRRISQKVVDHMNSTNNITTLFVNTGGLAWIVKNAFADKQHPAKDSDGDIYYCIDQRYTTVTNEQALDFHRTYPNGLESVPYPIIAHAGHSVDLPISQKNNVVFHLAFGASTLDTSSGYDRPLINWIPDTPR